MHTLHLDIQCTCIYTCFALKYYATGKFLAFQQVDIVNYPFLRYVWNCFAPKIRYNNIYMEYVMFVPSFSLAFCPSLKFITL